MWASIRVYVYTHHVPPISQESHHTIRSNHRNLGEKWSSQSPRFHLSVSEWRHSESKTTKQWQLSSPNTESPNRKPKANHNYSNISHIRNPKSTIPVTNLEELTWGALKHIRDRTVSKTLTLELPPRFRDRFRLEIDRPRADSACCSWEVRWGNDVSFRWEASPTKRSVNSGTEVMVKAVDDGYVGSRQLEGILSI